MTLYIVYHVVCICTERPKRAKAAARTWPWGGLSCRGQSAATTDGRHLFGQRAHLYRLYYRDTHMLLQALNAYGWNCPSLSGKRVGGQTALEMGLVNRAIGQNQTGDSAYREAVSLAREILPQVRIHLVYTLMCSSSSSRHGPSLLPPPLCFPLSPLLPPLPSSRQLISSSSCLLLTNVPLSLPFSCLSPLFPLSRPLSSHISFNPAKMPAVGWARVAVEWRNGPLIAKTHTYTSSQSDTRPCWCELSDWQVFALSGKWGRMLEEIISWSSWRLPWIIRGGWDIFPQAVKHWDTASVTSRWSVCNSYSWTSWLTCYISEKSCLLGACCLCCGHSSPFSVSHVWPHGDDCKRQCTSI